ncbi:unnamed protein product [Hyaloperonospora brassicae]|uniref:Uncharacterized protein n=1 Tax=Hyaloperonospora brassicae TaxID=162125 RepID=A0AAV0U110_HYABA|nr:unnamed protein product [Hyaloperonospora brassicae]
MTVLLPPVFANCNYFLVALVAPVALLVAATRPQSCASVAVVDNASPCRALVRRPSVLWPLLVLSATFAVAGASLELYYAHSCPTSSVFHDETEALARFVYAVCRRHHVPYWTAFGTLLFVMRAQHRIPVGDTDSDIGMLETDFRQRFGSVANFSAVVDHEALVEIQRPVHVVYHAARALVQVAVDTRDATGPHADIWLYRQEVDDSTGTTWLVNDDRTIRSKYLLSDQVLPLQDDAALFLNVPVSVPRNATYVARAEYGPAFMTPLTTRMECLENVLNGYTLYKTPVLTKLWYAATCGALVTALTLLAAKYIRPLRRVLWAKTKAKPGGARAADQREVADKYFV